MPDTPYLALDLAAFDRNAASMAQRIVTIGGKAWRPHVKAVRVPALAKRMLAAGACGVTVATVDEAEAMSEAGIGDVMIANILVGGDRPARLAELNRKGRVCCCVDDDAQVEPLDRAAREAGASIDVLVEVDIGLRRAGVADADAAARLAGRVAQCSGLRFAGLMAWEGHATRIADPAARATEIRAAVARLVAAAQSCDRAGVPATTVSCSGTGTYEVASSIEGVSEIQAGGGVFGDLRSRIAFGLQLEPALCVVATVVSRPSPQRAVFDAGWKVLGTFPVEPRLRTHHEVKSIAWSAEHAAVEFAQPVDDLAIGDRVPFDVGYSDSTVFLHDRLVTLRGDETWAIPRRRAIARHLPALRSARESRS